jgi:hypothetical protein
LRCPATPEEAGWLSVGAYASREGMPVGIGSHGRQTIPADAGQEERRRRLEEVETKIDQALNLVKGEVPPVTGGEYRSVLIGLLNNLSAQALRLHCEHVTEYRFYASFDDLTRSFCNKYPAVRSRLKGTLKGVFDRDGILHLNGGGLLFGKFAPLREFYAHEVTHSIDGTAHEISGSDSWRQAWMSEIASGCLPGMNLSKGEREGFAEFGRILLGTEIMRQEIAQVMPNCLKVWEDHGL